MVFSAIRFVMLLVVGGPGCGGITEALVRSLMLMLGGVTVGVVSSVSDGLVVEWSSVVVDVGGVGGVRNFITRCQEQTVLLLFRILLSSPRPWLLPFSSLL